LGTQTAEFVEACSAAPVLSAGGITNAVSFAPGPLSPGKIVTLFGKGMGPETLVSATVDSQGTVDSALDGTKE
jgi:hypothetical protein